MLGYRHLKALIAVAETGTLAEAARQLYVSQPAVSALLRALTEDLSGPVAVRAGRGMRLTALGEAVLPLAREAVEAMDAIIARSRAMEPMLPPPRLKVATSSIPGQRLLPRLLRPYRAAYPETAIHVAWVNSGEAIRLVRDGDADIGFTGLAPADDRFLVRPLETDDLWLVAPLHHPIVGSPCDAMDLQREDWIMRPPESGTRHAIESALRARGVQPEGLREMATADSNEGVLALVAAGIGIAFVSRVVAEPAVNRGEVEWVSACEFKIRRQLNLVSKSSPTAAADHFLRWLATSDVG